MRKSTKHNLTRIAFVEAIIKARNCHTREMCSCEYCADLIQLADVCGLELSQSGRKELVHLNPEWCGSKARDALTVLSIQHSNQLFADSNIFAGFMELPKGASEAYRFYADRRKNWDPNSDMLKRQTAFALASVALPDSYLDKFDFSDISASDGEWEKSGWEKLVDAFNDIEMPILDLPQSITSNIEIDGFWTHHFGASGCLDPIAGYGLEFGLNRRDYDLQDSAGLKTYVEIWPSEPDYFAWWDRSNEAGTCGGFIARSTGLLVSQQWKFGDLNDQYINAFNRYMAPLLQNEPENPFDEVIVVYSEYRNDAYIASTDPRSWDPNTPKDRVLLPLPDGYGLVGTYEPFNDSRGTEYVPTPLSSFNNDLYTQRLRAAARYLQECLRIKEQFYLKI